MKILIVDDNPIVSERIRGMLSVSRDMTFLEVSDPKLAHKIIEFGVELDVALVDLRYAENESTVGDSDGLGVCQKIKAAMPDVVIVGYSTSFSLEGDESRRLKDMFVSMGADIVCPLSHLTQTPASELRYEFQTVRDSRASSAKRKRDKIFIGSSTEGLEVANRIQTLLAKDFDVEVWNQMTVFTLGQVTIESLEKAVRDFQFAVFVLTPDDDLTSRGKSSRVARDNVIFEAGLFIGSLGRMRTFVVQQNDKALTVPSDLAGVTVARFPTEYSNLGAALGPACQAIRDAIALVRKEDPLAE
jgi:predicted nucleotide-binding protein